MKKDIINYSYIVIDIKFWHSVKPFLLDKIKSRENIILVNNGKITSDEGGEENTI